MSVHTVTIGGIPLVYEQYGSGPALVFIHGGNGSAVYWETLIPHLMGEYTCISIEQRGHGRSGRSSNADYSLSSFTNECLSFLDAAVGPAVLVGHSQGGHVAFGVAARRPDLVRGLYSEDAIPRVGAVDHIKALPLMNWFKLVRDLARRKEGENLSLMRYAHELGNLAPFGRRVIDVWHPVQLIFYARFQYDTDPAWYDALMNADTFGWPEQEAAAMPGKVRCPVHVAYGDMSLGGLVAPEMLDALKAGGLPLTSTYVPGAGHVISPNFPREFLTDLKAFLGRIAE